MRILAVAVGALALAGLAAVAFADDGLIRGNASSPSGDYGPPRESLIDEWNADQEYESIGTYAGGCFAFPYNPPMNYTLERVEFLAGGVDGEVTVQVRADNYIGTILGEVTYSESAQTGWQGQNLEPCVPLATGITYCIIYDVVPEADGSTAFDGQIIPYYYAADCTNYGQLWETVYWKARFYGNTDATPTEGWSWGRVKSLYR